MGNPAETLESIAKDCQPLIDYKPKCRKAKVDNNEPQPLARNKPKTRSSSTSDVPRSFTVTADVLSIDEVSIVKFACEQAGWDTNDVLFNYNGVPCETHSIASHTGKGRDFIGSIHGCNYRRNDKWKSPCGPVSAGCKYADKARLHDNIFKRVKAGIEFDQVRGFSYDFGIENPKGDLEDRDSMQPESWYTPLSIKTLYCCAYQYALQCKKTMMLATNMSSYMLTGTTGNGLCNAGQCGMCIGGSHIGKLARNPKLGPRSEGATKAKKSHPSLWIEEFLIHSVDRAAAEGRYPEIRVDVCAGWQRSKPVCEKPGLRYIAVGIHGDRNMKNARK